MSWEFRSPEVLKHEPAQPFLPARDDEDVSSFNPPLWIIRFEVRRTLQLFGRRLWTGKWKAIQMEKRA